MTIRGAILQLLSEGEHHGYQLKVDFEARTGGIWPLNVGQVYTTLERLVRDGRVVEADAGDADHRAYRITDDGRHELKQWLASSPVDTGPPRDELIMKVLLAMGRGEDEACQVIDEQRGALLVALQMGRRRQRRRQADEDVAARLAHDAVLTRIEADVTWLERCEAHLRASAPTRRNP
ncbi:MAG: PadR family transcriptional regulator [Acidimicrobiales bacterium]